MATEDHDFAEIASCVLPQGDPEICGLGDDRHPLMPVGMRTLGPEIVPLLEQAEEMFGAEASEVLDSLRAAYRPDARIGEAFSKFMVSLLGERSPLVLDSMLPSLKIAEADSMRRIVERRFEVSAALESETDESRRPASTYRCRRRPTRRLCSACRATVAVGFCGAERITSPCAVMMTAKGVRWLSCWRFSTTIQP